MPGKTYHLSTSSAKAAESYIDTPYHSSRPLPLTCPDHCILEWLNMSLHKAFDQSGALLQWDHGSRMPTLNQTTLTDEPLRDGKND